MLATIVGKRDFLAAAACAAAVDPRILHDAAQPRGEVRAIAELVETAQRTFDRELHEIVGVVLVARQRTREASQPRQQGNEAYTDFLRVFNHVYMLMIRWRDRVSSMAIAKARLLCGSLAALLMLAGAAHAQLPDVPIPDTVAPAVPLPGVLKPGGELVPDVNGAAGRGLKLAGARLGRIELLSRDHRAQLDRDPAGELVVRAEVVAIDITEAALKLALDKQFLLKRTQDLAELGIRISVLQTPEGWTARRGLKELRKLDPEGTYDYNHIYLDGGAAPAALAVAPTAAAPRGKGRVGLIDGGIDGGHQVFQDLRLHRFGC